MKSRQEKFCKINSFLFISISWLILATNGKAQVLLDSAKLDSIPKIESLAEALQNPDGVIKLSLRKQKIKSFTSELFKFKNLQYLDLSKNSIKS